MITKDCVTVEMLLQCGVPVDISMGIDKDIIRGANAMLRGRYGYCWEGDKRYVKLAE